MSDSPIKKCLFPAAGYGTRFFADNEVHAEGNDAHC